MGLGDSGKQFVQGVPENFLEIEGCRNCGLPVRLIYCGIPRWPLANPLWRGVGWTR